MTPRSPSEIRLRDPLSSVTRNERKFLLAASAIGLIVVQAGLVPTKIAALGIEFSQIDQKILLKAIGVIVLYFLFAFILYASSDFVAWRFEFHSARREAVLEQLRKHREFQELDTQRKEELERHEPGASYVGLKPFSKADKGYESLFLIRSESPISLLRALFEFFVPAIVGLIAVIQLFRA
jgi:hypothetical protein